MLNRAALISKPRVQYLLLGLILLATFLFYLPGVAGPFQLDDFSNLTSNKGIELESLTLDEIKAAAYSVHSSPTWRPVAMLSFARTFAFPAFDNRGRPRILLPDSCSIGFRPR